MALTDDQLALVRTWVGTTPTDDELDDAYDRHDNDLDAVIVETLREQIAAARLQPQSVTLPGLSVSFGDVVGSLERSLANFIETGGTETGADELLNQVKLVRLVRPDYR